MTDSHFKTYIDTSLAGDLASVELPDSYRAEAVSEALRVWQDVLVRRNLARRRVMLVGGGGYIGVPLAAFLLESGYDVFVIDMPLYGHDAAVAGLLGRRGYEYRRLDFTQTATMEKLLEQVTDAIILAGLVGDPITKKYPKESDIINEKGIRNLIDCCVGKGLNKVVFISTCSNYGEIPEGVLADEDYQLRPLSLYARAKVNQELYLKSKNVDFHWTIMRFATAFGLAARMRFDLTVNQFTREMFLEVPLSVYDPDTWRPYCHVRDFARALTRVLEAPLPKVDRAVFNAGGDANNFTKAMIVEAIKKLIPNAQYKLVEGGADRRNYKVSFARIRSALHFEPKYAVRDGIGEIVRALESGCFVDYDRNTNYYGNYAITYP